MSAAFLFVYVYFITRALTLADAKQRERTMGICLIIWPDYDFIQSNPRSAASFAPGLRRTVGSSGSVLSTASLPGLL